MRLLVSGYSIDNCLDTVALFDNEKKIWGEKLESPSFVAFSDGGKYMYTITEAGYAKVYSFLTGDSGAQKIDEIDVPGNILCHIVYSERNKLLIGSCYGTGNVFAVEVNDGRFGRIFNAKEEVPEKYTGGTLTRAHCSLLNNEETLLATANIALDRIYLYDISSNGLNECGFVQLPDGCGPRHLVYNCDESRMYIITEYSNEIIVLDSKDYSVLSVVSTLPFGVKERSNCSTLCFSSDYRYLYGANRFTGTIVRFALDENGVPEMPMWFRCGIESGSMNPRHMRLIDDMLVIANQDSGEVTAYKLDKTNGMPCGDTETIHFPSAADAVLLD